jgi:hypothetical protein
MEELRIRPCIKSVFRPGEGDSERVDLFMSKVEESSVMKGTGE